MKRHRLDLVSLLSGVLFVGVAIPLITGSLGPGSRHLNLLWALGAIVLGLAVLGAGAPGRWSDGNDPAAPAPGEVPSVETE